ncbi:uncharacterized protein PGTG_11235 [Puccinia graminis f. sp. tritici CRL 75-36-700-3]|uniref:Uncharacterized protein n=1 Tax=Puccinia graminis f. sp. tritici (strain CRL 75-36-700-3 / race SCCL) TaxID=418459 RepID=E3KL91_PUCGT|nr:uncharacterized protein PGTG_11235 [Puccinia graminis f. sp. tritici CRL 75-36-700-3]EFP85066.1 hypothetical protein PGTG_11235 [Puccinia graminis f. sp. tritici CRL 75-36-700-3]
MGNVRPSLADENQMFILIRVGRGACIPGSPTYEGSSLSSEDFQIIKVDSGFFDSIFASEYLLWPGCLLLSSDPPLTFVLRDKAPPTDHSEYEESLRGLPPSGKPARVTCPSDDLFCSL